MLKTTIAYGMSDLAPSDDNPAGGHVRVSVDRGGCGQAHHVSLDGNGRPVITCPQCAPALIAGHYGWANNPSGVPMTPDEKGEVEIAEREGQVAMRMAMKAMGSAVAQQVQGILPAAQPQSALTASALVAQLAAMPAAERAQIAALLQGDAPPAVEAAKPAAKTAASRMSRAR
jgi:hypothetical protein